MSQKVNIEDCFHKNYDTIGNQDYLVNYVPCVITWLQFQVELSESYHIIWSVYVAFKKKCVITVL